MGELNNSGGSNAAWVNAVNDNVASGPGNSIPAVGAYAYQGAGYNYGPGGDHPATSVSDAPYLGLFASFLNSTYLEGNQTHYYYEHSLDQLRGTWGIDTSTDTVWAVLDVGSGIFAVVPEPPTVRLRLRYVVPGLSASGGGGGLGSGRQGPPS